MILPSEMCRAWTAHSEGCDLTAYPDEGAFSIGYGHRGVPQGTVWTQQQADDALDADLIQAATFVQKVVTVPLTQGQCDALTDFCFNVGDGNFEKSSLLRLLNTGNYPGARRELYWLDGEGYPHGWIYAGGKIMPALIDRRKGEQAMWDGANPL